MGIPKGTTTAYIFLDEGGNLDFSPNGTPYFTITSVLTARPFHADAPLTDLRFELMENGSDAEYFHAANDDWPTRRRVFDILAQFRSTFRVDSVIAEKRKAAPSVRADQRFYPELLGYLLR